MDHFGIGAAMKGIAQTYFRSARQTGRTTSLVESMKDGDRIVFANGREAERVRRLCLQRGVTVECIVAPPIDPIWVLAHSPWEGRTIFDHSLIEQMYLNSIEKTRLEIDLIERKAGSREHAPETKLCAQEMVKWQY